MTFDPASVEVLMVWLYPRIIVSKSHENKSKYVDAVTLFAKTWTKGQDLWPHICWGHMCDPTKGSLCPSPMGIHQCMWIQWSILQMTNQRSWPLDELWPHIWWGLIVYGPVTETLHPPEDFWRPLFLETLAIGLLKSGCLQKSQCWIKPWGRFFQNSRQISTNVLFLVLFFVFRQFSFSLMKYYHLGLYYITIKSS